MTEVFGPGSVPVRGTVNVPGDKSLSHRAVLFSAMSEGTAHLTGVLDSADVRSTIAAVTALGARTAATTAADGSLDVVVTGWGEQGPRSPQKPVDCGNSGTTARLLMGVLAGWDVTVTLTGDESLSRRPMRRVTEPLTEMGASFDTTAEGTLPVTVHGSSALKPFSYESPVASAQVKTALLLAGLRAKGGVKLTEPALSRDHTERLLPAFGVELTADPDRCSVSLCGPQSLRAIDVEVARDPSSAAFMAVAAALIPRSEVVMPGVSLNPTRTGFLQVMKRMGATIEYRDLREVGAEPVGTVAVRYDGLLRGTTVQAAEIPSMVDEIPVMALAASQAAGTTHFQGVAELRVKESDRLQAIHEGLSALGVVVRSGADWLEVDGPAQLRSAELDSLGDHRLAMTWALAGLVSSAPVTVRRFEAIDVSYPGFVRDLDSLRG